MRRPLKDKLLSIDRPDEDTEPPSLDEMFVMSARQTLELATLLNMSSGDFVETMQMAWDVLADERKAAQKAAEETSE